MGETGGVAVLSLGGLSSMIKLKSPGRYFQEVLSSLLLCSSVVMASGELYIYIYIYILLSTDRMFRSMKSLKCG